MFTLIPLLAAAASAGDVQPASNADGPAHLAHGGSAVTQLGPVVVDAAHFTPWSALAGGVLIGVSSLLVLWLFGRTAGISGITASVIRGDGIRGEGGWQVGLMAGLMGSGLLAALLTEGTITASSSSLGILAIAGVCVGLGTRTGGGCTSGHGVCGLGRARPRSAVAVPVFMFFGGLTVWAMRAFGGAA